jgi:hypothetical protein
MNRKIITIILATAIGVGVGAYFGYGPMLRYKSEGILSLEMGTAEYKRFTELANDETTIRRFIVTLPPAKLNDKEVEFLISNMVKGEWHKPVAKINKADTKELPDIVMQMEKEVEKEKEKEKEKEEEKDKSEDGNFKKANIKVLAYLGLKITNINANPNIAAEVATWLGGYFKDVAARDEIHELVTLWSSNTTHFLDRASEQKLKYQFKIDQAKDRAVALKKVLANHPEYLINRDERQIVKIGKDNEKFLSPSTQIIAAESEAIYIIGKIQALNREIVQQTFAAPILKRIESVLKSEQGGLKLLTKIDAVLSEQVQTTKSDAEREKILTLMADLSQIKTRFFSRAEFIAQPSIPSRAERPTPMLIMVFSGLLFAAIAAIFVWRTSLLKLIRE